MKVENINIESNNWSVVVDGERISVVNKVSTAKLIINEKVQDVHLRMLGAPVLTGKLTNGREVKIRLGGEFKMHCYIFVDNELVLED